MCRPGFYPSDYDQTAPAISGTAIAWEDSRNDATAGTDVYMYDVADSSQRKIAGGNGEQSQPAISDGYIVWIDQGRLRALNRSTNLVFNVTTGAATQSDPALCGSIVTWTDTRNGSSDVYARNLAGGSEIGVATSQAVEAYPACDAGRIVYMRSATNEWASIRLYDVSSGQTTVVSDKPWNEWRPAISGDRVVWQAWPNQPNTTEGIQIRGKRLSTGGDFVVSDGPGNQMAPTILGSVVAWEDARDGDTRLWWRDLAGATGEQPVAPDALGVQEAPPLFARGLVYQSNPTGAWNIFQDCAGQPVSRLSEFGIGLAQSAQVGSVGERSEELFFYECL